MKLLEPIVKLYLDTTIPSYLFAADSPARMAITRRFMQLGQSEYEMIISDIVVKELKRAAEPKRQWLLESVKDIPMTTSTLESFELAGAYVQAGALPPASFDDAHHVAIATLSKVDALISWNFGHLVNIRRAKAIAAINASRGLYHIEILTPEEVIPA